MTPDDFTTLMARLTAEIAEQLQGQAIRAAALGDLLETRHPPGSPLFDEIAQACLDGVSAGWMCRHEDGGLRYGRVIRPTPATHGFSVDVVDMADVIGPHHTHPHGEIDMVMPLAGDGVAGLRLGGHATFDGCRAGWKVYGPGSAHRPSVQGGRALVLYLLPEGAIQFTASKVH